MLTWEGKPLTRNRFDSEPWRKHFEVLADALAAPSTAMLEAEHHSLPTALLAPYWWPTVDDILAWPVTTDCCPLEWLGEDA